MQPQALGLWVRGEEVAGRASFLGKRFGASYGPIQSEDAELHGWLGRYLRYLGRNEVEIEYPLGWRLGAKASSHNMEFTLPLFTGFHGGYWVIRVIGSVKMGIGNRVSASGGASVAWSKCGGSGSTFHMRFRPIHPSMCRTFPTSGLHK